jgi:glycolate oxidase iron-sulfur subunit
MQVNLNVNAASETQLRVAEQVLRSCVHCGFCNATCPTYQLLGDELDGPRGRIYLMKNLLEGKDVSLATQQHLDRCLTCRNCETTCPSGVQYHKLLDIGRAAVAARVTRPLRQRLLRAALRLSAPRKRVFGALYVVGNALRAWLPAALREQLPKAAPARGAAPDARHAHTVVLLDGCVQAVLSPNTNLAAARVLDRLGVSVLPAPAAGCCGSVEFHLDAPEAAKKRARQNIDAWWPLIEQGARAIAISASGCGAFIKEYGDLLADEPAYAERARIISQRAADLVEVIAAVDGAAQTLPRLDAKVAFHCPCTLQHAQKLGGRVEQLLAALGADMQPVPDAHLCCGSAGTYSLTEPVLSRQLRDRKIQALQSHAPEVIATANIGCQMRLSSATRVPVRHWVELLDEAQDGAG